MSDTGGLVGVTTDVLDDTDHPKGVANYIQYLTREFAARDDRDRFRAIRYGQRTGQEHPVELRDISIPTVGGTSSVAKLAASRLRSRDALEALDVLHTTAPRLYYFPLYRQLDGATVLTVHAMDLHIPPEMRARPLSEPVAWVQQTLLGRYFERTRDDIDAIITVSEFLKRELVEHLEVSPEKIYPVHLAPDERFEPNDDEVDHPFILSDTPEPELIDVFQQLCQAGFEHRLVIFSMRGYGYEPARRRARELGLTEEIGFRGFVSDEELVSLYNTASVYVRMAGYEGFGLPPIEAMACGCPVVTTDVGSLPEVVGDAGVMLPYIDVDGFVEAVSDILGDESRRRDLVARGLERAALFSWERTAEETVEVYETVMDA